MKTADTGTIRVTPVALNCIADRRIGIAAARVLAWPIIALKYDVLHKTEQGTVLDGSVTHLPGFQQSTHRVCALNEAMQLTVCTGTSL